MRLFAAISGAGLVALVLVLACIGPIPQDPAYHRFADTRGLLGIPRFGDVASNLPFLIIGAAGLWLIGARARIVRGAPLRTGAGGDRSAGPVFLDPEERRAWLVVFAGVALVGVGSAYYHWDPSTARLVWDRLPMTIVFTAFTAIQVMERIGTRAGARLLPLFLVAGIGSVVYWQLTESQGHGDLRPYAVVQYLPFLAIPAMLALFPARYTRTRDFAGVFACYGLAKIFEMLDASIFRALGGAVSGHTLKHLAAAGATACLLVMVVKRRPVSDVSVHPVTGAVTARLGVPLYENGKATKRFRSVAEDIRRRYESTFEKLAE